MYAAFPPLDHHAPVAPPQAAPGRPDFGEQPRTAGPTPGRYIPETNNKTGHAAALHAPDASVEAGWTFADVLDVINPLQHIPLVNLIYRRLTGDEIGGAAQIVGGGLFGGPIGAIAGTTSAIIAHQTGQSPGEAVISAFNGDAPTARAARAYVDLEAPIVKRYNFNQKA